MYAMYVVLFGKSYVGNLYFCKFCVLLTGSLEIPRFSVYIDLLMLGFAVCIDLFRPRFAVCNDLFMERFAVYFVFLNSSFQNAA